MTNKNYQIALYIFAFILSCWNWLYAFATASDVPTISRDELIQAKLQVLAVFITMIFLTVKGNTKINLLILLVPNCIWILEFRYALNNYHQESRPVYISMIGVVFITLILNLIKMYRTNKKLISPN